MTLQNFTIDIDADGIALVTWTMPDRSMNVIDAKVMEELAAVVEQVAGDAAIKGAVLTSGKEAFCGGADLTMLETLSHVGGAHSSSAAAATTSRTVALQRIIVSTLSEGKS